jgi:hypothetical protein
VLCNAISVELLPEIMDTERAEDLKYTQPSYTKVTRTARLVKEAGFVESEGVLSLTKELPAHQSTD